jgi:tetratricopeptide (TPR) repeat protein
LGAIVALATALGAAPAAGQPAGDARRHYEAGEAAYVAGRYDEAVAELTRAYELSKAPEMLFNIAQAHRLAGRCRQAVVAYETYVQRAPGGKRVGDARTFLAELGDCPAEARAGGDARITGARGGPRSTGSPGPAAGGPARAGHPVDRGGRGRRITGLVTAGVGAALIGTGVYFALDARDKAGQVERHTGEWGPAQQDVQRSGKRAEKLAVGFAATGAAALIGGTVLWFLGRGPARADGVTRAPRGDGAALVWTGRF